MHRSHRGPTSTTLSLAGAAAFLYWDPDKRRVGAPHKGAAFMPDATTLVDVINGGGSGASAYFEIQGRNLVGLIRDTTDLV